MAERIGSGTMVSGGSQPTAGTFVALLDVEGLMRVMDSGADNLVAYLEHPNVTMMAPIQSRLAAIVCANGDEQAHVAIVSRELGLPCAVQVSLDGSELADLEGRRVRLDPDGALHLEP
jgi:phosphoenolpyruvate synthase/pyruvate phosphate dikinase